jgi:hypothetical protein
MDGKLAFGRPLVVRFVDERESDVRTSRLGKASSATSLPAALSTQMSRNATITAIKNKLKAMEQEDNQGNERARPKRMKMGD